MNENAKQWVAALRSGDYRQSRRALATSKGHCCLGVACELAYKAGVVRERTERLDPAVGMVVRFDGQDGRLPTHVKLWLGLSSEIGMFAPGERETVRPSLSDMNDSGSTFNDIADTIEEGPEGLFAG